MANKAVMIWIYGKVQGVGFRYSTQRQARKFGLSGHARNLDDGSVELLLWGNAVQVNNLMSWIKAGGPSLARVDRVLIEPYEPLKEPGILTIC